MDMIETVARALYQSDWIGNGKAPAYEGGMRDEYLREARAAIEAMRNPTEAMRLAGHQHIPDDHGDPWASAIEVWQAMIEAALSPVSTNGGE